MSTKLASYGARSITIPMRWREQIGRKSLLGGTYHHLQSDCISSIIPTCTTVIPYQRRWKNTHSSKQWLRRQARDPYVKMAQDAKVPSRAYFKLEQMDARQGLFRPGQKVIDLGASPGGWSVYAISKLKDDGMLIAVDLLGLHETTFSTLNGSSSGFEFIQGDFTTDETQRQIDGILSDYQLSCVDFVMSDMAPEFTGDKRTDALKTMSLCEDALSFAIDSSGKASSENQSILKDGGGFLCKYFVCGPAHERDLMDLAKLHFQKVNILKPPASRKDSAERYLLATNFQNAR